MQILVLYAYLPQFILIWIKCKISNFVLNKIQKYLRIFWSILSHFYHLVLWGKKDLLHHFPTSLCWNILYVLSMIKGVWLLQDYYIECFYTSIFLLFRYLSIVKLIWTWMISLGNKISRNYVIMSQFYSKIVKKNANNLC